MLLSDFKQHSKSPVIVKKNVRYLLDLCAENEVKPGEVDLDLFGEALKGSARDLNKIFFSKLKTCNVATPEAKTQVTLSAADKETLKTTASHLDLNNKQGIKDSIAQMERDMRSYQINLITKAEALAKRQKDLDSFKEVAFHDIVENIVKTGFWEIYKVYTTAEFKRNSALPVITFITKEILLSETKGGPVLNFGRILINLTREGAVFAVPSYKQWFANIFYDRKCHPFLHPEGNICFGTGGSQYATLHANKQIEDVFLLLQNLLNRYSAEGPYARFSSFYTSGRSRYGGMPWLNALTDSELAARGLNTDRKNYADKYVTPKKISLDGKGKRYVENFVCAHCSYGPFNITSETGSCLSCNQPVPYVPEVHDA